MTLILLLGTAILSACGGETQISASPTSTPIPGRTPTPAATQTPFQGTRGPLRRLPPDTQTTALLKDVRIGLHAEFDRIVFEFTTGRPGYTIEYVDPTIIRDPSGLSTQIQGGAFLKIVLQPAAAHDPNIGNPTYTGPLELTPKLPAILEAEQIGDFEAILTWVVGLNPAADFRVTELTDPIRVVIDIKHP
ncbi:MAG TPA: hypothetical protein VNL15_05865 [Dehalococcoidia bacterium]|nr:hypothetical protein [Dehalococcoidia bacterium]